MYRAAIVGKNYDDYSKNVLKSTKTDYGKFITCKENDRGYKYKYIMNDDMNQLALSIKYRDNQIQEKDNTRPTKSH